VGRWTGSWLSGPAAAGEGSRDTAPPGARLGLPEDGPGSLAPSGRRVLAYLVDALASALVASAFTAPELPRNWSLLVFVVEYVVLLTLAGQTVGMRLLGLRVARVGARVGATRGGGPGGAGAGSAGIGVPRALARTALLVLLVPALVTDRDGRGLHDRAAGVAVVRA